MKEIKVGDTVYTFSQNRRTYDENKHCIYAEHFAPFTVISENEKEFVLDFGFINKRSGMITQHKEKRICFTEKEKQDDIFVHDNVANFSREISFIRNANLLRGLIEFYKANK